MMIEQLFRSVTQMALKKMNALEKEGARKWKQT
jgi:hypothetical protein